MTTKNKRTLRERVLAMTPGPGEEGLHAREIAKLAKVDYKQAVGVLAQLAPSGAVDRTAPNTYRLPATHEVVETDDGGLAYQPVKPTVEQVTRVARGYEDMSVKEYVAAQKNGKPDQATVVATMLRMMGHTVKDQDVEMALALNDLVQKW